MGYELKLIIGQRAACIGQEHTFENDNPKPTGRTCSWFEVYAVLDLCKIGHKGSALNTLLESTQRAARLMGREHVYYFFGEDGNTRITEDKYGDPVRPVPISEVLDALYETEKGSHYRRYKWAIALLESIKGTSENTEVMFFGH